MCDMVVVGGEVGKRNTASLAGILGYLSTAALQKLGASAACLCLGCVLLTRVRNDLAQLCAPLRQV